MHLSHYYFSVGGENFDARKFSEAANIQGAQFFTTNTIKPFKTADGLVVNKIMRSGVTGTFGPSFQTWQTPPVIYIKSKSDFLQCENLGFNEDYLQLWLREEESILTFLDDLQKRLPKVSDYCVGPNFLILKLVYGHLEQELAGGGHHYSEKLISSLAKLGANLSTDSVYWPPEFLAD